mgnify:CR=1 FL=1
MKGKKLLAGILSAAMVLGTMAFPVFADDNVLEISTAEELKNFADDVNSGETYKGKKVQLMDDIDLSAYDNWKSIGYKNEGVFEGEFDGNGKTISNLKMSALGGYVGLFGRTNGDKTYIHDFTVDGAKAFFGYRGTSNTIGSAIVIGKAYTGKMENVHVKNAEMAAYGTYVGGLVGHGYMTITDCSFEGKISGSAVQVGGIAGSGGFTATRCTVIGNIHGYTWVGGIIGNCQDGGAYTDCYVKGNISADSSYAGVSAAGIAAIPLYSSQKIEGCYNDASIKCGGEEIPCPVIGGYNCEINSNTELQLKGNSWNREICDMDSFPIIGEGGNIENPVQKQERDNNIVVNESDIKYVGGIENAKIKEYTGVTPSITEDDLKDNSVAEVNGKKYTNFASAVAAAQDGDTITLLSDVETSGFAHDKEFTLDLNGKTLKFDENTVQNDVKASVTYKNGTIDISGIDIKANSFWQVTTNGKLNFDNVKLCGDTYKSAFCVIYFVAANAEANFKDSTVELANDGESSGFIKGDGFMGKAVFNNTSVSLENTGRGFASTDVAFNNSKVTIAGTTDKGIENAFNICKLTVTDSTIDISGCSEYGIKLGNEAVEVKGNSKVTVKESGIGDIVHREEGNTGVLTVEENAAVIAENIGESVLETAAGNGTIIGMADKISVKFVPVQTEENVYDIKLSANLETINRLTSADLTFKFETSDDVAYELLGVDKITITPKDDNRYMFSLDGVTAPDITDNEITIAQVKFNGYGTFSFKVDNANTNIVNATAISDNLVESYYAGGSAVGKGELDISEKLENVTIAVPTKKLTINIAMNNKVTENEKAYQDMKVEIKGANTAKTFDLGSDGTAQTNGVYTVTADLEQNIPYTVTVSGAGYRTARYTVNLNADKTLNFWNNVMDNAIAVEEGNGAYKKNVTFLAGDIVKDNKINIYDLSAVVSYFGTDNLVAEHQEYAKYDLNRDGVIDSKDVAYVLVSWGN